MNCPACAREMEAVVVRDIEIDVCRGGCRGMWFDQKELSKFDEAHEPAGPLMLNVGRPQGHHRRDFRLSCPRCQDSQMGVHYYRRAGEVQIDECAGCGGIWLDGGELAAIRGQAASEDRRSFSPGAAASKPALSDQRFDHLMAFICPTEDAADTADAPS